MFAGRFTHARHARRTRPGPMRLEHRVERRGAIFVFAPHRNGIRETVHDDDRTPAGRQLRHTIHARRRHTRRRLRGRRVPVAVAGVRPGVPASGHESDRDRHDRHGSTRTSLGPGARGLRADRRRGEREGSHDRQRRDREWRAHVVGRDLPSGSGSSTTRPACADPRQAGRLCVMCCVLRVIAARPGSGARGVPSGAEHATRNTQQFSLRCLTSDGPGKGSTSYVTRRRAVGAWRSSIGDRDSLCEGRICAGRAGGGSRTC